MLIASPRVIRRLALASIVANTAIVVTGGGVRLTGSGLGCPTWPRCTDDSYLPTSAMGAHGVIEFGNRVLTWALAAVALATLVVVLRSMPRRRDLRRLAIVLFLGIPAQAVVGGISVLTDLNPWVVMTHFLLSIGLIVGSVTLWVRAGEGDDPARPLISPVLRQLSAGMLAVLALVIYLGTVVTGSGPHAGDAQAPRTGLDPEAVSRLHADAVFLLLGLSVALWVALHATSAPPTVRRAAAILVGIELGQGLVGYVQYFTGLPELLVALHMLGACLLVIAATRLHLATRDRGPARVAMPEPPVNSSAGPRRRQQSRARSAARSPARRSGTATVR